VVDERAHAVVEGCAGAQFTANVLLTDSVSLRSAFLVIEAQHSHIHGRELKVITAMLAARGELVAGVVLAVLQEKGCVANLERLSLRVVVLGIAAGLGILARLQEVVEAHGGKLADGRPVLLGELCWAWHSHELKEGGGVDGPYSVGCRICLGEGTEKVTDGDVSLLSRPPHGHPGIVRVHHEGVLLDDGREVFRNGIISDGCLAPFVISSLAESDNVDLEDLDGVLVPCKVGWDTDFIAVVCPTAPCRASMFLGGCNIRLKFPCLCNVEVTDVIIPG